MATRRVLVNVALAFVALEMLPGAAAAAACRSTVVVKDAADSEIPTAGQLRTAISEVCNGGRIVLQPGLVITLAQGQLVIPAGKSLTIAGSATIDAHGASRVISVQQGAHLTLRDVTILNGTDAGIHSEGSLIVSGGAVSGSTGRGIVNVGTAVLRRDATVKENQGGGIANSPPDPFEFPDSEGGKLTLEDRATVTANTAQGGAGISSAGVLTLNDSSSVRGNTATFSGGGITNAWWPFDNSIVTLNDNATVQGNHADVAGGIFNDFLTGTISVTVLNDRSRITGNTARFGAGVSGRGRLTMNDRSAISSNNGIGAAFERGLVELNDSSTIRANQGTGLNFFDGVATLNDESSIVDNAASGVSIIFATVVLNEESHVSRNEGGGISNSSQGSVILNDASGVFDNEGDNGGGIRNDNATVTLNDTSIIAGNVAALGGGVYNVGEIASVILNDASSITQNTATGGLGGGVYNDLGATSSVNDASSIMGNIPDDCFPEGSC